MLSFLLRQLLSDSSTAADMTRMENCFQLKRFPKGTILISEGQPAQYGYLLAKGSVRTYFTTSTGQEKTRHLAFEGAFVSSFSAFITGQASLESVETLSETTLYQVSRSDFYFLVDSFPVWAGFYRQLLESAYLLQHAKIEGLLTASAKERYMALIQQHPEYLQQISGKILASYLDISPETLSRIRAEVY